MQPAQVPERSQFTKLRDCLPRNVVYWSIKLLQCATFTFLVLAAANLCSSGAASRAFVGIATATGVCAILGMAFSKQYSATSIVFFSVPIILLMIYVFIPLGKIDFENPDLALHVANPGDVGELEKLRNAGFISSAITGTYLFFEGMCRKNNKNLKSGWWKDLKGSVKFFGLVLLKTVGAGIGYGWLWGNSCILPFCTHRETLLPFLLRCIFGRSPKYNFKNRGSDNGGLSSIRGFFSPGTGDDDFSAFRHNKRDQMTDENNEERDEKRAVHEAAALSEQRKLDAKYKEKMEEWKNKLKNENRRRCLAITSRLVRCELHNNMKSAQL